MKRKNFVFTQSLSLFMILIALAACQEKEKTYPAPLSTKKQSLKKSDSKPRPAAPTSTPPTPSPAPSPVPPPTGKIEAAPIAVKAPKVLEPMRAFLEWQEEHPRHFQSYEVCDQNMVRIQTPEFSFLDSLSPVGVLLDQGWDNLGIAPPGSSAISQLDNICLFFGFSKASTYELEPVKKSEQVAIFQSQRPPLSQQGKAPSLFKTIYSGDDLLEMGRLQKLRWVECSTEDSLSEVWLKQKYLPSGNPQSDVGIMILDDNSQASFLSRQGKKILESSMAQLLEVDDVYLNDNNSVSFLGDWPGLFDTEDSLNQLCLDLNSGGKAVRPILGTPAGLQLITCSLEKDD